MKGILAFGGFKIIKYGSDAEAQDAKQLLVDLRGNGAARKGSLLATLTCDRRREWRGSRSWALPLAGAITYLMHQKSS